MADNEVVLDGSELTDGQRQELLDAHALFMDLTRFAGEVGDACFGPSQTTLSGLSGMFIGRAVQSLAATSRLAQLGFVGDAMSCGRTVVEMAIDYAYIVLDPAERVAKFEDYDAITKYKLAAAVDKHGGGGLPQDMMKTLRERHDLSKQNNPDSKINWAGATLKDRATEGKQLELYEMAYAEMCTASHSCYGTLEYTLVWDEDGSAAVRFGGHPPSAHPIWITSCGMLILLQSVIDACKLDPGFTTRSQSFNTRIRKQSNQS